MKSYFKVMLIIMTFLVYPFSGDGYSPETYHNYVELMNSPKIFFDSLSENLQESEYLMVARDDQEFQLLLETFNPNRVYHNIRVIRLSLPDIMYPYVFGEMGILTAPYQVIQDSLRIDIAPISEDRSRFETDAIEDATTMGVEPLWAMGYNGTGITVGVIDTGIITNHPGLAGKVTVVPDFQVDENNNSLPNDFFHGTMVAGTIAATGNQINGTINPDLRGNAFGANLVSIPLGGSGGGSLGGDIFGALDYVAGQNSTFNIVNLSISFQPTNQVSTLRLLDPVVKAALDNNVLLVSSAGNGGSPTDGDDTDDLVGAPAGSVYALAVGALARNGNPASFTSLGPTADWVAKPDVTAPGVGIRSTDQDGDYFCDSGPLLSCSQEGTIQGTSFSSPLTAGALATLASALNQNGIPWNAGTLKTAIMKGATDLGNFNKNGKGLVNALNSFNLLRNLEADLDGPKIVEITPKTGPYSIFATAFTNVAWDADFSLHSSHPNDVVLSMTGNLSNIATLGPLSSSFSQRVPVMFDTTGASIGKYTGTITATVGNDSSSTDFTVSVTGIAQGNIAFDRGHTNWDDVGQDIIGGSNTGSMINVALQNGLWVTEVEEELTPTLLDNYDVLWMPDPLSLPQTGPGAPPINEQSLPNPLLSQEIDAIVEFVNDGGNLVVDFNGPVDFGNGVTGGTDVASLNLLLNKFNVTAIPDVHGLGSLPAPLALHNVTSPVGGANTISHVGTRLQVVGDAIGLTSLQGLTTVAIYEVPGGGKVLITSTNFWMDNFGIAGNYPAGADDKKFSENMWKWFLSDQQMIKVSDEITSTHIRGEFKIFENGLPAVGSPVVKALGLEGRAPITIPTTKTGDIISFDFELPAEGTWAVEAVFGTEYLRWDTIVDNSPPVISLHSSALNFTRQGAPDRNTFIKMVITDAQPLTKLDMSITLNGETNENVIISSYNQLNNEAVIFITSGTLVESATDWNVLTLTATDLNGQSSSGSLWFYVGDTQPPIPGVTTTSSSSTTTTTSVTPTTTETPTESDNDGGSDSLFPFYLLSISFVTISIVRRYRKKN